MHYLSCNSRFGLFILFVLLSVSVRSQTTNPSCTLLTKESIFTQAPFEQCHASTLIELDKNSLMAAWFGGSYEGAKNVCIWASTQKNGTWSTPFRIICGGVSDSLHYACWNPVLFRTGKNQLILYYKVGLSPREWWGMSVSSFDNGQTWTQPQRLTGIAGPIKNKPLQLASGTWLNPSSTETMQRWKVFIERSVDRGKTWEKIPVDTTNTSKVIQPTLLVYPGGKIQALCRSNQNYILESWSFDDGKNWSALEKTNIANPNSGIDAVTLSSGLQVLVYNPTISGKEWVNGRNQLNVAVSRDGKTWKDVYQLENQPRGEFSYPAIIQSSDGIVHISYTYNRKTINHVAIRFR
jgi:alpha-L-fucosidase